MKKILKVFITKMKNFLKKNIYRNSLKIFWYKNTHNFGDAINPLLVNRLTGKKVFWINTNNYKNKNFLVIGSILDKANKHSIIWGSGFISEESKCMEAPKEIFAVRGPKTRQKLLDSNIYCPEVYGDPALLLPSVYSPKIEKKYKLGIIPHYIDKDVNWLKSLHNEKDVKLLDIQEVDPFKFINDLLSCERVISSSLHGIIVADAYRIPSLWVKFSDNIDGGNFKFLDYFMSVGRKDKEAFFISKNTGLDDLLNRFYDYKIKIDLELLLNSCPFECSILGKDIV